jgi:uncharacterized protein
MTRTYLDMPRGRDGGRHVGSSLRSQLVRWWGWLVVGTCLLACLVAIRYFSVADLELSPALFMFRSAMLISHFALLSAILLLPMLLLVALLPRAKLVLPIGILLATLVLCALLVDTQVFHLYRFHINAGVMNLLFGGAALETFVFPRDMYLEAAMIFFGVMALVATVAVGAWRYVQRGPARHPMTRSIIGVIAACTVAFHAVHVWGDAVAREAIVEQTEVLPFRYAATAKRMLRKMGVPVQSRNVMKASAEERNDLAYPLRPLACTQPSSKPNIIFIVVDSWRFDAIGADVAPNVHAFADRTVRFTDHYSGGNATRIGVFSLFYSIPGTYWHRVLAEQQRPVFIDELQRSEYELTVLRSAPLYSPEFDRTIFAGVENVRMRSEGKRPFEWDRDLTNDFKQFLDTRNKQQPFFALLFYDSPHSFDMPPDYATPFKPNAPRVNYLDLHGLKDATPFVNRYKNSVHYVDGLVGEALAAIEANGLLENSVIVITGDHGQEFDDSGNGFWGHGSNFTRYQTGVPLMLYAPDLEPRTYDHRTSHFDVVPTLLQKYFGCNSPMQDYSVGHSLFTAGGRDVLLMSEYADFAIVQPDLIAVVREHGLDIVDANNDELNNVNLAPHVVAKALEQKQRFYGKATVGE